MNRAARVNSSTVYCIAEDLDGEIWIGTDKGVKVIYYPSKVFDGTALPNNILLEQEDMYPFYLNMRKLQPSPWTVRTANGSAPTKPVCS